MDIATVIGFVIAFIAVVGSIIIGGSSVMAFWDPPSVFVVFGGLIGAVFIKWPMDYVKIVGAVYMKSLFTKPVDLKATIEEIQKLAETARRESVFALEKVPVEDPFMKKAVTLAADNRPPEVISGILQVEIDAMAQRHSIGAAILDGMGADGPAMGMLGTLIGLVIMLNNLSGGAESLGKAMAVAIITTFYGSLIANVVCIPVASKLKLRSQQEQAKMNIIVAGVLGIVAGENPRVIREKLDSFLPARLRQKAEEKA
jgi:chemotaxis protein MotA